MHILLKDLLKEAIDDSKKEPLRVQIYCDMDGVLSDFDASFKKISGGKSKNEYDKANNKVGTLDASDALIKKYPNFWSTLKVKSDAKTLWKYITDNFKILKPVILTVATDDATAKQKAGWIHKNIDSTVQVNFSTTGKGKANQYFKELEKPITHLLIDDTDENVSAWKNIDDDRFSIKHESAAKTISQLEKFKNK